MREVSSLRSEVAALKDQLSRVSQTVQSASVGESMMLSDDNTGSGLPSASSSSLPTVAHPKGVRSSFSDSSGRWFDLIVSSIGEQATGTPRAVRLFFPLSPIILFGVVLGWGSSTLTRPGLYW